MKKGKKKAIWVASPPVLALTLIAGSTLAGRGPVLAAPEETEANTEDPKTCIVRPYSPGVDLKGRDVRIVNWYEPEPQEPRNQYEEDRRDYINMIQDQFDFTIHTDNIGGWGEGYTTLLSSSITAGDPIGQICTLEAVWVPGLLNNLMMAPLDTLSFLNFKEEKWNQGVLEATKAGGHIYGMAVGHEPRYGIFYNKRLLQEAGYGADTLYDLQRDGAWNWSKFEEVLRACTRDTNHDGDIDTWGMVGFNYDYYMAAIYSSGAEPLAKDAEGHFINQMDSQDFLKALNWANDMWQKYAEPQPMASDWDYFKDCFNRGDAAMRVTEEYAKEELGAMSDEWGFVMFPSPDGQEPVAVEREQVVFIPSSYSIDEANEIAFAYDLYTDPVPGYEDGDVWKEEYYSTYSDPRAVDETLNRMRNGKTRPRLDLYVPGLEDALGAGFIWDISAGAVTPEEALETQMPEIKSAIRNENKALERLGVSPLEDDPGETEPEDPKPESPRISLGTVGIGSPTSDMYQWCGDYVHFGMFDEYPVKYRVLSPETDIYGGKTMLLECVSVLYLAPFDQDGTANEGASQLNDWQYSDVRAGLNGTAFLLKPDVFSEAERNAIAASVIASHDRTPEYASYEAYSALTGEKIFLLDIEDIQNPLYGYDSVYWDEDRYRKYEIGTLFSPGDTGTSWWLRSASVDSKAATGYISGNGEIFSHFDRTRIQRGVSPALNVDLSRVLFSTLISEEKNGSGCYKLTLLDDEIRLHVLEDRDVVRSGNTLTLSYSVAGRHKPNRLSVLVLDQPYTRGNSTAQILQYESVAVNGPIDSGIVTIELDPEIGEDCYIYLVAEDVHNSSVNDTLVSDYASVPVELFPTAEYSEAEPTEPETEPTEEATTEPATETPTVAPTEAPTEALTEAPTEAGSEDKQVGTLVAPTEAASDTKGNNVWPFVICGAVILLGAIACVIIKRKQSRKD